MFLLGLAVYVLVQLGIAAWAARGTSSDDDYLVAGRSLGIFAVAMSLFATWFAAETVIATSAETASQGLAGARVEPFGYGLGIVLLGMLVAHKVRASGHLTLAGFLGERFGPHFETICAVIIAMSATVWGAAQLYALAILLGSAAELSFLPALFIGTGIIVVYTWVGGLKGDVVTDIIQGLIIVAALVAMLAILIGRLGGPGEAFAAIPQEAWSFRVEGETLLDRMELWLIPILGTIVAQEAISRLLGAKSPEVAQRGAYLGAGLFVVAGLVPVALGLMGQGLGVPLGEDDNYFPSLVSAILPGWMALVVSGALLSAILSSVDSALLSVSGVATESGYRRLRPDADGQTRLRMARLLTVAAAAVAALIAASGDSVRDLVLEGGAIGSLLIVPGLMAVLTKNGGRLAAPVSVGIGLAGHALLNWALGVPGGYIYALALSGLAYALGLVIEQNRARA